MDDKVAIGNLPNWTIVKLHGGRPAIIRAGLTMDKIGDMRRAVRAGEMPAVTEKNNSWNGVVSPADLQ